MTDTIARRTVTRHAVIVSEPESNEVGPDEPQETAADDSGGLGDIVEAKRRLLARFAGMAEQAAATVEQALAEQKGGKHVRGSGDRYRMALYVCDVVLDRAPMPEPAAAKGGKLHGLPSDPAKRSELAEKLRLAKQAERRR